MKTRTIFLVVVLALVSVGAFAQPATENPDPDPGGNGGGGLCYFCAANSQNGNQVHCEGNPIAAPFGGWSTYSGYTQCTPHNSNIGPGICTLNGSCIGDLDGWPPGPSRGESMNPDVPMHASSLMVTSSFSANVQSDAIAAFLRVYVSRYLALGTPIVRRSRVMTKVDIDDFVAATDYELRGETWQDAQTKRLAAYRAKFHELTTGIELEPGRIPGMPHEPTKAPAATLAAR